MVAAFSSVVAAVVAVPVGIAVGEAGYAIMVVVVCFSAVLHRAGLVIIMSITETVARIIGIAVLVNTCGVAASGGTQSIAGSFGTAAMPMRKCRCRQECQRKNSNHESGKDSFLHSIGLLLNDVLRRCVLTLYTIEDTISFH